MYYLKRRPLGALPLTVEVSTQPGGGATTVDESVRLLDRLICECRFACLPEGVMHDTVVLSSREWTCKVAGICQLMIGQLLVEDAADVWPFVLREFKRLPAARSLLERLLLRSIMADLAHGFERAVHPPSVEPGNCACAARAAPLLTRIWRDSHKDPRKSFAQWLRAFTAECSKAHPPTPPDQAARALRGDVERRLDPADLARTCGCSPQSLRREFRRRYAMSPREYHHLARLVRMLPLIFAGTLKNEAIAAEVGYRSKKDFYKYFKRLTGMRPSDFKRLTREDADALLLRTRSRLLQRLTIVTPLKVDRSRIRRKPVPVRTTS